MYKKLITSLATILALSIAGAALAKDELPDQTEDGLVRIKSKNVDAVYWREGATLDAYSKVLIIDAEVAFKKNWMRDYNRDVVGTSNRVRSEDMERIKAALSKEFTEVFTKEMTDGGYEVVSAPGDEVLVLRPAIINLDVTAPDLQTAGMNRSYVSSAGDMTLYLELYDSATGSKIGTVLDAEAARDLGYMQYSNRVTNKAEADRMFRKWSHLLIKALDEAHKKDD